MNVPVKAPEGDVMESLIIKGDLAKLTPDERVQYYHAVCKSLGLNALTQPLSYITLNGKLTLYATRTCTDQLRKINGVSLEIVSRHIADDILTVHVKAHTPDGRVDEDFGSVAFSSLLKGEARANAVLKAVTKAKRRATLSICGLGWPDETEVETIPGAKREITESAGAVPTTPSDAADAAPFAVGSPSGAAFFSIEDIAREAAGRGAETMRVFWNNLTEEQRKLVNKIRPELNKLVDAAEARMEVDDIDLGIDIDPEHRRNIEAYQHGKRAKADGHQRKAIPPEYREPNATRAALCWQAGFDGQTMPEFNQGD